MLIQPILKSFFSYKKQVLIVAFILLARNVWCQPVSYVELNGGVMRYDSEQNNLVVNPTFGINVKQQFTPVFGLEFMYSGAQIDELVPYSDKFGITALNEQFIAHWFGARALFGKNAESWSINGLSGLGFRAEKKHAVYLELGIKHTYQLYNAFWLHTSTYVQMDKYMFNHHSSDPYSAEPLDIGLFLNVKLGIGYHFN
jgi:hypothetical protein